MGLFESVAQGLDVMSVSFLELVDLGGQGEHERAFGVRASTDGAASGGLGRAGVRSGRVGRGGCRGRRGRRRLRAARLGR